MRYAGPEAGKLGILVILPPPSSLTVSAAKTHHQMAQLKMTTPIAQTIRALAKVTARQKQQRLLVLAFFVVDHMILVTVDLWSSILCLL